MRSESPVQSDPDLIPRPATVDVVGVPLAVTDYDQTLRWMDGMVSERRRGYVCACNAHTVMAAREDPELRSALLSPVALNVPDGQPLVWAMNALGHSLVDRVYGPELMGRACARAAQTGQRLYLYGGRDEDALTELELSLRRRFPGLNIVGTYAPPFRALTMEERTAVAEVVRDLYRNVGQPEQSYSERQIYQAALDRLVREFAAVERIDESTATQRLEQILNAA